MADGVPARRNEVHVTVSPSVPLVPLLPAESPVDAPAKCHARAHTELEGGVVRWGTDNRVSSASDCCEACARHAQAAASDKVACNIWVFCADHERCGDKIGQCWLKHTSDPSEPTSRGGGMTVPWISGSLISQPAEAYKVVRRQARAARQHADLSILKSAEMLVGLRNETGTIELLTPHTVTQPHFSFPLPLTDVEVRLGGHGEYLDRRADGFHHLGDVTLRATPRGEDEVTCSTVGAGLVEATAAMASPLGSVAGGRIERKVNGADAGDNELTWRHIRDTGISKLRGRTRIGACPVSVTRTLESRAPAIDNSWGLTLYFDVTNPTAAPVTLGSLGFSMPFDQDFVGRTLTQVAHQCSFVEPFLGLGGGYVQVTRATGVGPVLLILPVAGTEFEAWRPLRNGEDSMRLDFMYEMTYELMVHSKSYASNEWRNAKPWNTPTARVLGAGETARYGLRLLLAPSLDLVELTLLRAGVPVVQPLPSPVIASDVTSAALLVALPPTLVSTPMGPAAFLIEPQSALSILSCADAGHARDGVGMRYRCMLRPGSMPSDGRVRVVMQLGAHAGDITGDVFAGTSLLRMSVHLFFTGKAADLIAMHGRHGVEKAWLPVGTPDPWHRDGAFFGWDDSSHLPITQERRVYMSGLSDEAGAGAGLAIAVKQVGAPNMVQIARLEEYVNHTLYQGAHNERSHFLQSAQDDSVRLSLLYWTDEMNDASSEAGRAATATAPHLARVCRSCWPKRCSWMDCW